jgi:nicotinamidase/pyrazinamidase
MIKNCLFVIDPQKDFMPGGALGVPGADEDMKRLAAFISSNQKSIDNIIVTLDSHHYIHIAHPSWWSDAEGNAPAPFTPITLEDVTSGKWKCAADEFQTMTEYYLGQLAESGVTHMVWPPHCIIGSDGHAVEETLFDAIQEWEKDFKVAEFLSKGANLFTEHFGAFEAVVPIAGYDDTTYNFEVLEVLEKHEQVIVAGEASSHCVAQTLYQMISHMSEDNIKKIVYLSDACSPVTGCEAMEQELIEKLKEVGVTVTTTADLKL